VSEQLALDVGTEPDPDEPQPGVTQVRIRGERGTYIFKDIRDRGRPTECVVLMDTRNQQWRDVRGERILWPRPKQKRRRGTPK
jgi:hypothetical protein